MKARISAAVTMLAVAVPAAATVTTIDRDAGQISIPVGDASAINSKFPVVPTSREGTDLENLLGLLDTSGDLLREELSVLGTSADEQEVTSFGADPSGGLTRDFYLGLISGLSAGARYTAIFSFMANVPPPAPGVQLHFFGDEPIRRAPDEASQRLVRFRFTAPVTRGSSRSFFLLGRPEDVPKDFGIAQVALEKSAVPETDSWLLLVTGFGVLGHAMRSRRRALLVA